jgi:hypothetical protein
MGRLNFLVAFLTIGASTGVGAVPAVGLESELLKAALSSGFLGLMLLWFVYTARQTQLRDREEATARETRLADRLNRLEDETRSRLIVTVSRVEEALGEFKKIAEYCQKRSAS